MRPSRVILDDLNDALSVPLTQTVARTAITDDIFNMFVRAGDERLSLDEQRRIAMERFDRGRALYQGVWRGGHPQATHAVFYRIDDRSALERQYVQTKDQIKAAFAHWARSRRAPITDTDIITFFSHRQKSLPRKEIRSKEQQREFEVLDYFLQLTPDQREALRTPFTDQYVDDYRAARTRITERFRTRFPTGTRTEPAFQFFEAEYIRLAGNDNRSDEEEREFEFLAYTRIQTALSIHNRGALTTPSTLPLPPRPNVDEWFKAVNDGVEHLAESPFYQILDVQGAYAVGTIYGPGPDLHNWGVNAGWALAVARSGIPIKILSDLNEQNATRSHPNEDEPLNPSAFSLEIAIAIQMGYGLNINNGTVLLTPPRVLADHRTNGQLGNGPLPTKEAQVNIYRRCKYAKELHALLPTRSGADFRDHIHDRCTRGTPDQQMDLVIALVLLRNGKNRGPNFLPQPGNSLDPILNALTSRELASLNTLVSDPQFDDPFYQKLRNSVHTFYAEYVRTVCNGVSSGSKVTLADTLRALSATQLEATLNIFPIGVLESLNTMLAATSFNHENYRNLRTEVRKSYFSANLKRNSDTMRDWVQGICTGSNATHKSTLADVLRSLNTQGQLGTALNNFRARELASLGTMLSGDAFNHDNYRNLKTKVRTFYFAAYLKENNNSTMRDWAQGVCTGSNAADKSTLADALRLLNTQGQLGTVLNNLRARELGSLDTMLSDDAFNHDNYRTLKADVRTFYFTAYLKENNNSTMRDWVQGVCTGSSAVNKSTLADALRLLNTQGQLRTVLNNLRARELGSLNTMLSNVAFNHDNYRTLKANVRTFYFAANLKENNNKPMRDWVQGICNGRNVADQVTLVNALCLLSDQGQLGTIAPNIRGDALNSLNRMLSTRQFSDPAYDNIRNVLTAAAAPMPSMSPDVRRRVPAAPTSVVRTDTLPAIGNRNSNQPRSTRPW